LILLGASSFSQEGGDFSNSMIALTRRGNPMGWNTANRIKAEKLL